MSSLAKEKKKDEHRRRYKVSYNRRDLILYALGLGCKLPEDLRHLYEGHPSFAPLPSFYLALPFKGTSNDVVLFPPDNLALIPDGITIDPQNIFHLSQALWIFKPLNCQGGEFTCETKTKGAFPMGKKGTGFVTQTTYYDSEGEKAAEAESTTFIKGFSGTDLKIFEPSKGSRPKWKKPDRPPDAVSIYKISHEQAAIYRLSGDYNPLHISPEAARKAGMAQGPILHGLCTLGVAARALCGLFCPEDPGKLCSLEASFSRPVLPGDVLQIRIWKKDIHQDHSGLQVVIFDISSYSTDSSSKHSECLKQTKTTTLVLTGGTAKISTMDKFENLLHRSKL